MEGCWCVVCLPLLPFSALYRKTATGPDSYTWRGVLFPFLLPFEEHLQRVHGTNGFHKVGEPCHVDVHSSASYASKPAHGGKSPFVPCIEEEAVSMKLC